MNKRSLFFDAPKRTNELGVVETFCKRCKTWDSSRKTQFYQRHGEAKCDPVHSDGPSEEEGLDPTLGLGETPPGPSRQQSPARYEDAHGSQEHEQEEAEEGAPSRASPARMPPILT
jgi:hypothetical protein